MQIITTVFFFFKLKLFWKFGNQTDKEIRHADLQLTSMSDNIIRLSEDW